MIASFHFGDSFLGGSNAVAFINISVFVATGKWVAGRSISLSARRNIYKPEGSPNGPGES